MEANIIGMQVADIRVSFADTEVPVTFFYSDWRNDATYNNQTET